ncbi:zinc ribbon domain-containing protein [Candidatus Bathyarchaeota archaeon]|nr:zinc ribbon domain-containing protein [Candidatus Bathyarchaeota archaeon]
MEGTNSSESTGIIRPPGITIIVLLEAFGSSLSLFAGILLLAFAGYASKFFPRHPFMAGALLLTIGIFSLLLGIAGFLICWGLWTGQGWAWSIALALAVLKIILGLLQFPLGIFSIVIYALIAYYLWQPHVKAFYGKLERGTTYGMDAGRPVLGDRVFCPKCGASNTPDANFCFQCGTRLREGKP